MTLGNFGSWSDQTLAGSECGSYTNRSDCGTWAARLDGCSHGNAGPWCTWHFKSRPHAEELLQLWALQKTERCHQDRVVDDLDTFGLWHPFGGDTAGQRLSCRWSIHLQHKSRSMCHARPRKSWSVFPVYLRLQHMLCGSVSRMADTGPRWLALWLPGGTEAIWQRRHSPARHSRFLCKCSPWCRGRAAMQLWHSEPILQQCDASSL